MSPKWYLVVAALMALTPGYLLWQGDQMAAAFIAIPSFFICVIGFALIKLLSEI